MKRIRFTLSLVLFLAALPTSGWAHFLWIASGSQASDGKVHVYFSESVAPDEPELLDRVAKLKLWQWSRDGVRTVLDVEKDANSLAATPAQAAEAVFGLSHDYGVMSRGGETFLLKYHATSQPTSNAKNWRAIGKSDELPFEIVPSVSGREVTLTVLWQGKPLADSPVTISGPGIEKHLDVVTSAQGKVGLSSNAPGLYSVRAKQIEAKSGELDGKGYTSIRHYTTLALSLAEDSFAVTSTVPGTVFPALDPGITSFGGAIIGDELYVYGGHFGQPHHYSMEGQSDRLLRLNLAQPSGWEQVAHGPRRTGLAAVAHGGKFYRIGGFEARNQAADKQSLWSMSDFARFDPVSKEWESLTPLPSGRSSHDAVVIGNLLYVIGGWELSGEGNTKWHDSAYVVDLSAEKLVWTELPKPPFQRRAISVGAWQGKVYVIGGMQSEGGTTTATAFYDPASMTWGEGPKLNGESMDGFGSSAFLCGQRLFVSTFSGSLQALADDGQSWINLEKLSHPRFFHRMLPLNDSQLVVVGGASMKVGKIRELEVLTVGTKLAGQ
ncbi:hypothetical protein [Schlesneria paludicola]|uniref:hypothetical protein n=1 Tax=Schlesneria paludicola TaxID=360056 RepID=UPI0003011E90|nr:hypothetical protein [Schlesneria paludicola]